MITASVIGSGPNGLPAAIVLAGSGIDTTVFERNGQIGLACSSAETTLPNFLQDLGSSAYPLGVASPFFLLTSNYYPVDSTNGVMRASAR